MRSDDPGETIKALRGDKDPAKVRPLGLAGKIFSNALCLPTFGECGIRKPRCCYCCILTLPFHGKYLFNDFF